MAVGRSTATAAPVPAAALPADHNPPANPPVRPSADPGPADSLADEPAPALSSWRAVAAVCALLTVVIGCAVRAVVYPRLAVLWQIVGAVAAAVGAAATVVTSGAARVGRRGSRL
ncbi:hypothetical protein GCM10009864_81240 [Streptomyces lunalinharesii]|uniref:SpdD-like protein n=1 Tax=Streptomyces lunalinharesii TaxID=333384 RepID=A0ABP6FKG0_9ACTN